MVVRFPCKRCLKSVNNNHNAILCDICESWVHIKCNKYDRKDYNDYKNDPSKTFHCLNCIEDIIPFSKLNDNEFDISVKKGINLLLNPNTNFKYSPSPTQQAMYDKLNILINQSTSNDSEENSNDYLNCNYYNIDEFNKEKFKSSKSFSILHLNIHSLQLHIDELRMLLEMLNFKFDIIALSESKLQGTPIVDININGYHVPLSTPTNANKGGVIIYVANHINYKPRKDLHIYDDKKLESVFIEIINDKKSNEIIGVIYRHPLMDMNEFNDEKLDWLLKKLINEKNKNIYLAGDFNFDLLKVSTHEETSSFFNQMTSNFLLPVITIPTKINTVNDTLIDNIFTNQVNPDLISGNFTTGISDHLPCFLIIPKTNANHLPKNHNIYTRDTNNFDKDNFLLDLLSVDWEDISNNPDVNSAFNNLLTTTNNIINSYMPLRKITNKEYKRKYKPWITTGILKSISRKNKLHHKYIKFKDILLKNQKLNEYKVLKHRITELIRISKQNYYRNYFTDNNNNLRKIWIGIKEVISIKSKNQESINCILQGDKTISNPNEIANSFNTYFSTIADNLLKDRKFQGNKSFTDFLTNPLPNSFAFRPCDDMEIQLLISEMNINKSTGPNGIHTKILQMIKCIISQPLSNIYNASIVDGKYIEKLKLSKTIPTFKKGSRLQISNYRPISLLSNLNKIMEKLVFNRLYAFLEKYNCLYKLQYGFRSKHSTTHALIDITENIRSALDGNKLACGIFVDLQKAFDTVNHEILLEKLNYYGIRGNVNNWFKSYLQDRKQIVSINGYESDVRILKHGVPQGSVLGPLLFLLYINDLNVCINNSKVYHFADDTNLLHINSTYKKLQKYLNKDLKNLCSWLLANKISLNCTKTELIYFRKPNNVIPNQIKIKLNGKKLIPTDNIKYLGIYLDDTLSGKAQYNELSKKLYRSNSMLAKCRDYVPANELKSIYYAIFSSHLTYGLQVWGQCNDKYLKTIFTIQKNALRIISFSEFSAHSIPLF